MDGKEAVRRMVTAMDMKSDFYRIGQSKIFLHGSVLAQLEEDRDTKLGGLIILFQAQCRARLAHRLYQRRVDQSNAIRVLQRNGVAWLKLRNWQWWRLYTKVKPLLQVTNQEAVLKAKEEELRTATKRLQKRDTDVRLLEKHVQDLTALGSELYEQLKTESDARIRTEENNQTLQSRVNQLTEAYSDSIEKHAVDAASIDAQRKELKKLYHERVQYVSSSAPKPILSIQHQIQNAEHANNQLKEILKAANERYEKLVQSYANEKMLSANVSFKFGIQHEVIKRLRQRPVVLAFSRDETIDSLNKTITMNRMEIERLHELDKLRTAKFNSIAGTASYVQTLEQYLEMAQSQHEELMKRVRSGDEERDKLMRELQCLKAAEIDVCCQKEGVNEALLKIWTKMKNDESRFAMMEMELEQSRLGCNIEIASKLYYERCVRELEVTVTNMGAAVTKAEAEVAKLVVELNDAKSQLVSANVRSDKLLEEIKKKLGRDIGNMKKQKKFDITINEERNRLQEVMHERDQHAQDSRDRETKNLSLQNQISELQAQLEDTERTRRALQIELDDVLSSKDDFGKNFHDLERQIREYENERSEIRLQMEELEDNLQASEDRCLRMEVNANALKADHERALAAKDQDVEDRKRQLQKMVRDLETELEEEKRQRAAAEKNRKRAESSSVELERQLEIANRLKDDYNKQLKKVQLTVKDTQQALEDLRQSKDETNGALREAERRIRALDAENQRLNELNEELYAQKRKLEQERDELEALKTRGSSLTGDEKARLESRIAELEDELEEEQTQVEQIQDRFRRCQTQLESLTSELSAERTLSQKLEMDKQSVDRINRELRSKIEELETTSQTRSRALITSLESKINSLEESLALETTECNNAHRTNRRLEKKLAERNAVVDDLQRQVDNFKDEIDKLNTRYRTLRREFDERGEENTQHRTKVRSLQRQIDEHEALNENLSRDNASLTRELNSLRNRRATSYRTSNMIGYVSGSGEHLEGDDRESVNTEGSHAS
uniref:Myosin motor domain-containing protein n=1 Tax=Panagrellus redivivus TaxID=6233 RepID=A0A7E4W5I9_PANRE